MAAAAGRPLALVTGASAGIGAALAAELAARGYDLALVARRRERLDAIAVRLRAQGAACFVMPIDLAAPGAPRELMARLSADCPPVDMLINNAGYGLGTSFGATSWSLHRDFLQVLLLANVELAHLLLPGMVARGRGRIANISSLAALAPDMPGSLYSAVKKFMLSFTCSLQAELRGTGVTATAVCPGLTYSEFHDVLGNRSTMNRLPRWLWMDAATVAKRAVTAVEAGRTVVTPGVVNKAVAGLCWLLPTAWLRWLMPADLMAATSRVLPGSGPSQ